VRAAVAVLLAASTAACSAETDPPPPEPAAWRVVLDEADLGGAVLSVWGPAPDQPFVVGGPLGNDGAALALRYDGLVWHDLAPGGTATFWWVHGTGADDVWMVGEEGRIVHWDGAAFEEHDAGIDATVWGVFAFARDEVWVVAGNPGAGMLEANDIVARWDGTSWTGVPVPTPYGSAFYKVWGTSPDDLYVVGENGVIWHRTGGSWQDESVADVGTLFTTWGCSAGEVYAVGGYSVLRSSGGGSWDAVEVELTNQVNGVSCSGADLVLAGNGGLKQRRLEAGWTQEFTEAPYDDLHAAWASGGGVFWTVGGDFVSGPSPGTRRGVVARYGPGTVTDHL
jgi:hypothetical protein